MQSAAGSVNLVCMPQYNCIHDSWNAFIKMGEKITHYVLWFKQSPSHSSHQAPSAWWHPQADPAPSLAPLSCTVKPSIPRKIKGDLYYACMIYSCCYFLCSRHRWKPIQLDWWRGKNKLLPHPSLWIFMWSQVVLSPAQSASRSSVSPFWVSDFQPYLNWHILRCSRHRSSRSYCDFAVSLPIIWFIALHLFIVVLKIAGSICT